MRNNKMYIKKGFTLTEMLVVVLIISVLAAIAYPLYTKTITKSRAVEAINLLEMVRNKQLVKFAKDREYYKEFSKMGQLTSDKDQEIINEQQLKIKDYTLSLNNLKSCMTAKYEKGNNTFTFSSSYETTGLGCTGNICSSFGNIVGGATDVCNCGSKSCNSGYTLNNDTCSCECLLGCQSGSTCYAPYGGGSTRACSSGCGTQTSSSSCSGAVWTGSCSSPTQSQPTTKSCGSGGTQTRTCTASCSGGTCGAWGLCSVQDCTGSKPAATQNCGNCGTQSRTVECNSATGVWGIGPWSTCSGSGICSPGETESCGTGGTQTCSSSCRWSTCSEGECNISTKPISSQSCGKCGTQTRAVSCNTYLNTWSTTAWTLCSGEGICTPGTTQSCNTSTGSGKQTCSSSCTWGTCGASDCDNSSKPATSQSCGNCSTGTQTRTVTCNSSTSAWTTGTWGTCSGGGTCAAGATQSCGGGNGTQTCSSSCTWGSCVCKSGYTWNGTTCVGNISSSTKYISILVSYEFTETGRSQNRCGQTVIYGNCSYISGKTYYDGGDLHYEQDGRQGPSMCNMGLEGTEGYSSGWDGGRQVSLPSCPSGTASSICQSACTSSSCNYSCILSESYPKSSSYYTETRCIGGCEAITPIACNDQEGSATVLVCSR